MTEDPKLQWNNDEIARHLKSAMDTLTPDVLDRIDLRTPQELYADKSKVLKLYRKVRTAATVMAACLCVVLLGGGVAVFQNGRVDSFIGIDVNPSIELSVNRNDKVLKAEALNGDAAEILEDMDLKNVDLNIAVNAVIGSMVRHGYLEGTENAILVTVANDDKEKAAELRQSVVGDIEVSLEEHKLEAVVYDQQAPVTGEVKQIAKEYGISYGKAYFLQELVAENDLTDEELKAFAGMTMEEISKEIADRSYSVRKDDEIKVDGTSSEEDTAKRTTDTVESTTSGETESQSSTAESTVEQTHQATTSPTVSSQNPTTAPAATTPAETQEEEAVTVGGKAKIDYVDYDGGNLSIVFKDKVKWKNPAISVKDENGESYSAKIIDTGSDSCEIQISDLPGGIDCSFTLSGVAIKDGGSYNSVKGYFDTPEISGDEEEPTPPAQTTPPAETPPTETSTEAPTQPVTPAETTTASGTEGTTAGVSEGTTVQ